VNLYAELAMDGYKLGHRAQYPEGTERVMSNLTPRSTRVDGVNEVVFFGLQYFLQEFLGKEFDLFFGDPVDRVVERYARRVNGYLGPDNGVGTEHIRELHELGYLPLVFKAWPEGSRVPIGMPMVTVENTDDRFFWLVNYLETLLSCELWLPITSATTGLHFRERMNRWAQETGGDLDFVNWQGHDFSMRGMGSAVDAAKSGAAHLLSFWGTDTVPALDFIDEYYPGSPEDAVIGGSVAATEHSVMCAGGKDDELDTYSRLMDIYPGSNPEGFQILSVVSDTWDLWNVLTNILPQLREKILARNGKLVIRPDSGDPVKIICGDYDADPYSPAGLGVVELLWREFGGTVNEAGYKVLDSHIGVIYGDGISPDRCERICAGLAANGFASTNVVFGLGSYTYQYVTRDTYGMAMKATWVQIDGVGSSIFKKPVTDDGGKFSATGRLAVTVNGDYWNSVGQPKYHLIQNATPEQEAKSLLTEVWRDGEFVRYESFQVIRDRVGVIA
jgi:nicotinamide phosphoribosyltransferase